MIKFFGCSFTEGGGLNNVDYYNWLHNTDFKIDKNKSGDENDVIYKQLAEFRNQNRFSKIVSNKLNLDSENYSLSGGSNDYILKTLFNHMETNNNEIYVVVFSLFSRVRWYYEKTKKIYNLNSYDFSWFPYSNEPIMKSLSETYEMYLSYIYNLSIEKEKLKAQVKLMDCYAKSKNSKIYWASWEDFPELNDIASNYISFDNLDMFRFVLNNKLQIFHHTNDVCNDNHISLPGNEIIGNMIYDFIKKDI